MSFRTVLVVACSFVCCCSVPAKSQCGPNMEKQIAQIMNTWVQDWNEKRMDDLTRLYYSHAVLLPADGSRVAEQGEIREYLEKQIGTKIELQSPGAGCISYNYDAHVAIENGTYKQSGSDKSIEGHYLVVLVYMENAGGPRWVIAQQALTAKPQSQVLSRNLGDKTGTR